MKLQEWSYGSFSSDLLKLLISSINRVLWKCCKLNNQFTLRSKTRVQDLFRFNFTRELTMTNWQRSLKANLIPSPKSLQSLKPRQLHMLLTMIFKCVFHLLYSNSPGITGQCYHLPIRCSFNGLPNFWFQNSNTSTFLCIQKKLSRVRPESFLIFLSMKWNIAVGAHMDYYFTSFRATWNHKFKWIKTENNSHD